MSSSNAIYEFKESCSLESDAFGNLTFDAVIVYRSPARNASEITNVKILRNGYEDGKISLTENGELVAEDYHLDFTTAYQKYEFLENDKKLLVTGNSTKMGGKYEVSITLL